MFRVALQFVHEMQEKAQKNFNASKERERVLPVFGVGVAYIDESTIYPEASNDFDKAINEMKLIVSNLAPPVKPFFVVPTERIYSPDLAVGGDCLTKLGVAVNDITGKEDLLKHLRMLCLQKVRLSLTFLIKNPLRDKRNYSTLCCSHHAGCYGERVHQNYTGNMHIPDCMSCT